MQLLTNIIEPKRLLLAWQASDATSSPKGKRYIIGELVRELDHTGNIFFRYMVDSKDFTDAKNLGFQGYPAFNIESENHQNAFDTFARRIPPRTRSDFQEYLKFLRIDPNVIISDFALLGYSGASLPSDAFSFIHPFENVIPPCELVIEIDGFRYHAGQDKKLHDDFKGSEVTIEKEPNNQYDKDAIKICHEGDIIGHIKRGQTEAFSGWIDKNCNIKAVIEKINGIPDRPNVLLYVWVK